MKDPHPCGITGEKVRILDEVVAKFNAKRSTRKNAQFGPHGVVLGKQPPYSYQILNDLNGKRMLLSEGEFDELE